ncbi:MAG: ABC transporter permease [Planctomycetia bacterium]|nr:ABC transporter permease [Planctomycetia bacterium]
MLFWDTLRLSIKSLTRNLMRSLLTMIGIVIGVAAVIAMMEIGQGSSKQIQETIARMGANNLMIQPGAAASGGISLGGGSSTTLTLEDVGALQNECGEILDSFAPVVRARTQLVYGNKNWVPFYLYGSTPSYLDVREWDIDEGACFSEQDVRNGVSVCLIGQTIVREVFGGESPIGHDVRINNQPFRVIGTLTPKGANMMGLDQDDMLIAPWTAIKYKVAGTSVANTNQSVPDPTDTANAVNTLNERYPSALIPLYPVPSTSQIANNPQIDRMTNVDLIWVRVSKHVAMPGAKRQIVDVLHRQHRIRPGQADDFNIRDMTEQNAALGSSAQMMGSLLLFVALVSLLVGGVGIMNIMLVTVTERTREIGLRMAVGARPRDILRQFLIEAVILCLLGGAFGILCGRSTSAIFRTFFRWPTEPSLLAVIASVSVSVIVGIVFGYYPAWKASRLDPIQALRYE